MLKLVKKMFVEFRISFVFMMTMGTCCGGGGGAEGQSQREKGFLLTNTLLLLLCCGCSWHLPKDTYHNVADDAQAHDDYAEDHGRIPDVGRNLWRAIISRAIDLHRVEEAAARGATAASGKGLWWRHGREGGRQRGCCCCVIKLDHMIDGQVDSVIEEGRY